MTIDEVSIVETMDRYGITRSGRIARCCFHGPDANPSMRIYEETQTFYCFGCGKVGDSATLVAFFEQVGYYEACRLLGVKVTEDPVVSTSPLAIAALLSRPSVGTPPSIQELEIEFASVVRGLWGKLEHHSLQNLLRQFDDALIAKNVDLAERLLLTTRGVAIDACAKKDDDALCES